jgi:hypothetical protein
MTVYPTHSLFLLAVVDTNVALHQIDFLESTVRNPFAQSSYPACCHRRHTHSLSTWIEQSASGALRNVIILQTVLEEVKHRSMSVFVRLKTMVQAAGRRFHVFGNENHTDTHVQRVRDIRAAAALGAHSACILW